MCCKSTLQSVKMILGEPTKKNAVELIYDNFGIGVAFKGKNENSPIEYLCKQKNIIRFI